MKASPLLFCLIITGWFTVGCNPVPEIPDSSDDVVEYAIVQHDELFSIEVADYMYETGQINPYATLAYGNHPEEVFLMVIEDVKSDLQAETPGYNLESYYRYATSQFDQGADKARKDLTIAGMPAILDESIGDVNERKVRYMLAVMEGKAHYYQVMAWTSDENTQYFDDLEYMIKSLKEI